MLMVKGRYDTYLKHGQQETDDIEHGLSKEPAKFKFDPACLLLEADGHHGGLYLLDSRFGESEVEAVVGQVADLLVVAVVAHAHDGDLRSLH